ncbi:hypothetical protein HJC23_000928 [Cyclotella cryptica]|uniref:Pseudouridine synthase I TruA alpha/beta domain-containing protein n=1 Tax=Cyclotella cryptica TaxID=29204 RepID=A0ABD3QM98_9STRA|eukprot:CCRYP_004025-RB/>CCRYP_004025-RB protein AED:0.05 eAED:0.05 QI:290/1/1/1/0.8/0.66/6/843/619
MRLSGFRHFLSRLPSQSKLSLSLSQPGRIAGCISPNGLRFGSSTLETVRFSKRICSVTSIAVMDGDKASSTAATSETAVGMSNERNCAEAHCGTKAEDGLENKNERHKKGSNKKAWSKNKKKKEPWYRNRGEQKRQKLQPGELEDADEEGKKERPKNNRRQDNWDANAPKTTPHEGSFAHPDMQKLFHVEVDVPATSNVSEGEDAPDGKLPKRKLGILVSFLGSNYGGFQINAGQRTLQAELELALFRAGIISSSNFGWPSKYSWSNSARTDKGVHAAAQVCSMKGEMIFHNENSDISLEDQLNAMRKKVNEYLPVDIRVLDIERVTKPFCARTNRDKVRYQYMVPSYVLCSREEVSNAFKSTERDTANETGNRLTPMEASNIVSETITPEILQQARSKLVGYRTNASQMSRLKDALKVFEGTHSFHNYTRRIGANDASATRYIISFVPLKPIVVPGEKNDDTTGDDTEWIPVQVTGQSFLLNQIRKMISAAVDLARGTVTREKIEESLTKKCRMKVNVAPAQGLFLDRSFFDSYNRQKAQNSDHRPLNWVEGEEIPAAVKRIEEFKNDKIIPHIVKEEANEGNFLKYLYCQDVLHAHDIYSHFDSSESGKVSDDLDGI